jgi:hypothetical protein
MRFISAGKGQGKWVMGYLLCTILVIVAANFIQKTWMGRNSRLQTLQLSASPLISITSANHVYDLSGSEAYGGGDPFKLFDEHCDPKINMGTRPATHPIPFRTPDIYFPKGKGLRIVVDLQALHELKEVFWYDRSLEKDTIWLYTGQMNNWKEAIVYESAGLPSTWGWKSFAVNRDTRFIMLRFNHPSTILTEMALYGNAKEKIIIHKAIAPTKNTFTKTLREFAGTNSYDYVPAYLLQPFHQTRLYQQMSWYDADTVHPYPKNEISLNYFNLPTSQTVQYWADSIKKNGNGIWMSVFGLPAYLIKKGLHEKDKPVTEPGMNTENPMSYARHANMFWNLAAVYGANKVDTGLLNVKERPRFSGLNLMNRFENGNEEDAYWTPFYWSPMDYFAVSSADYDGHENRMGAKHGIKNADTTSLLITSGMVQLDTNRVKTLKFLCEQLRSDRKFIWQGGVQYHYYSNITSGGSGVPTKAISPEADQLRQKLAKVKAFQNRLLPGVPVILGENGYDRIQQSWQAAPLLPGKDAETSQAVMIVRSMMAAFMAGFDGYNQYMMRNATNDENATGAYGTSGMIGGPETNKIYKAWHYWNTLITVMGDYRPDSVISETGNVWVYKLRHETIKNKVAYYIISPTTNGSVIKKYIFNTKNIKNQLFTEIKISDSLIASNRKTRYPDQLEITVDEFPNFLLFEEQ